MTTSPHLAQRLGPFVPPENSEGDRPIDTPDILRVIAIGPPKAVEQHIMQMYQLGYAQPHEWSRALPTVNPDEVMRILTKRIVSAS